MSEPVVAYSVKEVLTRIEMKLDANTKAIHELQMADAAAAAVSRSRAAIYSASLATIAAGAALIVAILH